MKKKKISIVIPCYNEEENIKEIVECVKKEIKNKLSKYSYEILVIDNKSKDDTRNIVRKLCKSDNNVHAIFNIKNFGQFNSPFYAITQASGDCVITICADFQDPVELIPVMVKKWEEGNKVICMVKTKSYENKIIYGLRSIYYDLIKKMSDVEQIKQFTGFGLYDKSFVNILKQLDDPTPFIRGMVAEYAPDHLEIEYTQPKRKAGKTHNNFFTLFDAAMLSFTSYTNGLRIAEYFGALVSLLSFIIGTIYLVLKITNWYAFDAGQAPILISVFFLGGVQLAFLGFLGEYVISINRRVTRKPLVIEEERINF